MKQFDWSSFEWDKEFFPDPKGYLSSIKKEFNIKVCVWINPYICKRCDHHAERS
jgi:alpha-glucosidase (family GH31 glycosyl hydrolase)